jgi:hypothetical protein
LGSIIIDEVSTASKSLTGMLFSSSRSVLSQPGCAGRRSLGGIVGVKQLVERAAGRVEHEGVLVPAASIRAQ